MLSKMFKEPRRDGAGAVKMAPDEILPICPQCRSELPEVWKKEFPLRGYEKYSVLMCPHCRVVLGTLNERGLYTA